MRHLITGLFAAVIFMSSCTIKQTITFNQDQSGHVELTIDLSQLAAFDEEGTMMRDLKDSLGLPEGEMSDQEGISNMKVDVDTIAHTMKIAYDFANVDALNRLLSAQYNEMAPEGVRETGAVTTFEFFKFKGKKLTYTEVPATQAMLDADTTDLGEMDGMFTIENEVVLPGEVKQVKGGEGVSHTGKTVSWTRNISNLNKNKKAFSFSAKMK